MPAKSNFNIIMLLLLCCSAVVHIVPDIFGYWLLNSDVTFPRNAFAFILSCLQGWQVAKHEQEGLAWLKGRLTALRFWASTLSGAAVRFHDHQSIQPDNTMALSLYQLVPDHPHVKWHSAPLNAGCLSPTGYY